MFKNLKDCSFGSKEFGGHSSISSARRHSGKGAWWNSKDAAGNAGTYKNMYTNSEDYDICLLV